MFAVASKRHLLHSYQSIVLLAIYLPFSWSQTDLLPATFDARRQFCFRKGHQSAVIDNRLYIDGGYLSLSDTDSAGNRDNTSYAYPDISYHDLRTIYQGGSSIGEPPLVTNQLRAKPSDAPRVSQGTFWPDTINKKLYLYGGQATYDGEEPPPSDIWMYDAAYDSWRVMDDARGEGKLARLYRGASAVATNLGLAYYLGGWIDNRSEPGYSGNTTMTSGLLVYDMVQNAWRNESLPAEMQARAEGTMVFLPIGDNGSLVYFGGVRSPDGRYGSVVGVSMQEIHIYDIATSRWYLQYASGRIPSSRRQICSDVAIERNSDNAVAAYNIYMYGGASGRYNETIQSGWDQVYVLSLPSFVWTRYWPSGSANPRPRYGHTCNIVNNAQMLVIGGEFPEGGQCDSPTQAGVHNLNISGSEAAGTVWVDFDPSEREYTPPSVVQQNVQGVKPNWTDPNLEIIFSRTPQRAIRTPTRFFPPPTSSPPPSTRSPSGTTIIAVAVSVPVAVIIIGIVVFFIFRRRQQARNQRNYFPQGSTNSALGLGLNEPDEFKGLQRSRSITHQEGLELLPQDRFGNPYKDQTHAPQPVAYFRDPVTGGWTPAYDQTLPTTYDNAILPEELPATRRSIEVVEAGWQEHGGLRHELQPGGQGKTVQELPGDDTRKGSSNEN